MEPPQPTTGDWIGLYLESEVGRNYVTYQWISLDSNKVTFTAPYSCGSYVMRYHHNKTYTLQGSSSEFSVGPVFSLTPALVTPTEIKLSVNQQIGEQCPNLWVAIYPHGEINPKSYLTYAWAKAGEEVTFQIRRLAHGTLKPSPTAPMTIQHHVTSP